MGGTSVKKKLHLVRWKEVTKTKAQDGLGVGRIKDLNESLLLKWWWRYGSENGSLWKSVVLRKYGHEGGGWSPNVVINRSMFVVWQDILSSVMSNTDLHSHFVANFKIVIGNGEMTHFWRDWLVIGKLEAAFPRLFNLSETKDDSLKSVVQIRNEAGGWQFSFRRPLRAWEKEEVKRLVEVLEDVPTLRVNIDDQAWWNADPSGSFSVSPARRWSESAQGPSLRITKLLWGNGAPPREKFFGWLAWKDRVKTAFYLQRIGVLDPNVNIYCLFCRENVETTNHILLHCPLVWRMWSELLDWWNLSWVIPGSVGDLLEW